MSQSGSTHPNTSKTVRKKTPGACERCREKRIKCDGVNPCDQCSKKGQNCVFTFPASVGNDVVAEKLDLVLARLDRLEQSAKRPSRARLPGFEHGGLGRGASSIHETQSWLAQPNPQTGCLEYYGCTSYFAVASSLGKRMRRLEEASKAFPPQKRLQIGRWIPAGDSSREVESLGLNDLTGFCDYVIPSNATLRQHRCLRSDVTDRHVESFFRTIHIFLPLFDVARFKAKYAALRSLFGDNRLYVVGEGNHNRQQFLCLVYAVLSLGALYEDQREDSPSWASWYFAEAQGILGRLLDAVNLELVQAAMLMGAYAQHAIQPNLAYNLNGISSRLAFSIGLNILSTCGSPDFDAEEARRTLWLIYIQEVELSLDSGRPMSIRTSDMHIAYPMAQPHANNGTNVMPSLTDFIQPLAEIAKIIQRILKLVNLERGQDDSTLFMESVESIRGELQQWHASIPTHLRFYEEAKDPVSLTEDALCSWQGRQRSSLRIHYNLAMIILHRSLFAKSNPDATNASDRQPDPTERMYKISCLDAASDMLIHIHQIFSIAPRLRRWSYYCFYCLQATLVILMKLTEDGNDEPAGNQAESSTQGQEREGEDSGESEDEVHKELKDLCELSVSTFEQIELKAAKRCAQVVRRLLARIESRERALREHKRRRRCRSGGDAQFNEDMEPLKTGEIGNPADGEFPTDPSLLSGLSNPTDGLGTASEQVSMQQQRYDTGINFTDGDSYDSFTPSSLGGSMHTDLDHSGTNNSYLADPGIDILPNHYCSDFSLDMNGQMEYLSHMERAFGGFDNRNWFY